MTAALIPSLPIEAGMSWKDDAPCAQSDPEAFFPEKGGSTRPAKVICKSCDVREKCLEYALERDERFGIWGGYSERERRRLKRGIPVLAARGGGGKPIVVEPVEAGDHGSHARYVRGCRCSICQAGNAAYMRAYMEATRIRPQCQVCGSEVRGRGRRHYCSTNCRELAKAERLAAAADLAVVVE